MEVKQLFDLILVLATMFTTVGAFFLVRSIIQTGAREMAAMAGTYIGSNPHLQTSLVQQKADTLIGFALTLLGGIFGFISTFISFEIRMGVGAIACIFLGSIIAFFSAAQAAKLSRHKLQLKTNAISFSFHVESYISHGKPDVPKLFEDAKRYGLSAFIKNESCQFEAVAKVLRYSGANPGADYILSLKNSGG